MLTEDYIIRMINLGIAALLRILGLKKDGKHEEGLQLIDLTLEQLLGLRANVVKGLDDDRLYYILTRNDEIDTRRLILIADLFKLEGDIYADQGRKADGRESYARALKYTLEVARLGPMQDPVELAQKIDTLVQALGLPLLQSDTLWSLFCNYEESGVFGKAEEALLELVERPEVRPALLPEVIAFYERMQSDPNSRLTSVDEKLSEWRRKSRG